MFDEDGNPISDPTKHLVAGTFTLNGEQFYDGFYFPSVRWNGFYVPYFTKEVAEQMLEDMKIRNFVFGWHYDAIADSFIVYDDEVDNEEYEVTGSGHYSIGGFFWVWQLK